MPVDWSVDGADVLVALNEVCVHFVQQFLLSPFFFFSAIFLGGYATHSR